MATERSSLTPQPYLNNQRQCNSVALPGQASHLSEECRRAVRRAVFDLDTRYMAIEFIGAEQSCSCARMHVRVLECLIAFWSGPNTFDIIAIACLEAERECWVEESHRAEWLLHEMIIETLCDWKRVKEKHQRDESNKGSQNLEKAFKDSLNVCSSDPPDSHCANDQEELHTEGQIQFYPCKQEEHYTESEADDYSNTPEDPDCSTQNDLCTWTYSQKMNKILPTAPTEENSGPRKRGFHSWIWLGILLLATISNIPFKPPAGRTSRHGEHASITLNRNAAIGNPVTPDTQHPSAV